jgi:hypothetical protein
MFENIAYNFQTIGQVLSLEYQPVCNEKTEEVFPD